MVWDDALALATKDVVIVFLRIEIVGYYLPEMLSRLNQYETGVVFYYHPILQSAEMLAFNLCAHQGRNTFIFRLAVDFINQSN